MINYDLTKIKALAFDVDGVLSNTVITVNAEGEPLRTANIKDGYALHLAAKLGMPLAIITGGKTQAVRVRYESLGVQDVYLASSQKTEDYEDWKAKYGLKDEEILYVGDDIPDYQVLQRCGCSCCPTDAAPEIQSICTYISPHKGGEGVARDIIEQVLKAQGRWMACEKAFGW
ncbi:MAG: HAD hydrolase family protein [Bacteroidales bacterium]|nr:HAD hydrolase family protein [Bacteroidales bacterium]